MFLVNELNGFFSFVAPRIPDDLLSQGSGQETGPTMTSSNSSPKRRNGLRLHGVSLDLRMEHPQFTKVDYTVVPDIDELYMSGRDDEVQEMFLPLARAGGLHDENSLFLLVRSLIRTRRQQEALELMEDLRSVVFDSRNLIFEYILLSARTGRYASMNQAIEHLEEAFGNNGVHSKVLQALLMTGAQTNRVEAYIQRMRTRFKHKADYEILRAAFNSKSWPLALRVAPLVPNEPRSMFLAMRTYQRTGRPEEARALIKRLDPSNYTNGQILTVLRVGLPICDESSMLPWFDASSLSSEEIKIEVARGRYQSALADGLFQPAFEAFRTLYRVDGFTTREILTLLRANNDDFETPLRRLFEFGGTDPSMLAAVAELGIKFNFRQLALKAFERLESMVLCASPKSELYTHYLEAATNSGDAELLTRAYETLPSLNVVGSDFHQFASYFERLLGAIGQRLDDKERHGTGHIEALLLTKVIEAHSGLSEYEHRPGHAVIVNNSLKFGGAERQVVRCLSSPSFSKDFVLWNHSVNNRLNSFIQQVEDMNLNIFDYSIDTIPDPEVYTPQVDALINLIPCTSPFNPGMLRKVRNLVTILSNERPYSLHLWQDSTNVLGAVAGLIAGVPRIVMSARSLPPFAGEDSSFPDKGPNYYYNNRFVKHLYKILLSKDNVYLCHNSENGRQKYVEWLGGFEDKMPLLRNGFDFTNTSIRQQNDKKSSSSKVLGAVFRFVEVKQPLLWLDVAASVSKRMKDVTFRMVGDGPMLELAMKHASDLGIASKVDFLGYRDDVHELLPSFDAFLLTSAIEGLPNVLIEAQSMGVPVISTNAGGARETFLEGKTGRMVDSFNVDELADAVCDVLSNETFQANARTIGRERTLKTFGEAVMHAQLHNILFEGSP